MFNFFKPVFLLLIPLIASLVIGLTHLSPPVIAQNNYGRPSILWRHFSNGAIAIWQMNGSTRLSAENFAIEPDQNWKVVGTGDFNGDRKSDILWRHFSNGAIAIWQMNGSTRLSAENFAIEPDQNWKVVGTGDFNGDGKSDILWRHFTNGQLSIWQMNGSTRLSAGIFATEPDQNWKVVPIGDFNANEQITKFVNPMQTPYTISLEYGEPHPTTGIHLGIDLAPPLRTNPPVYAAAAGKVLWAGWKAGGFGNMVKIDHGDGLTTIYMHLDSVSVALGQEVQRSQQIGIVGATGNASGTHLHFQVEQNGQHQNPRNYVKL
jgi:murein DD-endopeptidase MepM/ murein hydrolase activator NlpD